MNVERDYETGAVKRIECPECGDTIVRQRVLPVTLVVYQDAMVFEGRIVGCERIRETRWECECGFVARTNESLGFRDCRGPEWPLTGEHLEEFKRARENRRPDAENT